MIRHTLSFLSALTLLLCGGLLVLWVMSSRSERVFQWGDASRLTCSRGRMVIQTPQRGDSESVEFARRLDENMLARLGFLRLGPASIPPNIPLPVTEGMSEAKGVPSLYFVPGRRWPLIVSSIAFEGSAGNVLAVFGWQIGAPVWFLVLILVPLPMRWIFLARRRSRRVRDGLCLSCGYDLRASTNRCPECGVAVPALAKPRAAL